MNSKVACANYKKLLALHSWHVTANRYESFAPETITFEGQK